MSRIKTHLKRDLLATVKDQLERKLQGTKSHQRIKFMNA